jgi:hypothetical protein
VADPTDQRRATSREIPGHPFEAAQRRICDGRTPLSRKGLSRERRRDQAMPNGEQHAQNGYEPHELVVELAHEGLITAKLEELGLAVVESDPDKHRSAALDLALLDIADFDDHTKDEALTGLLREAVARLADDPQNPTDAGPMPTEDEPSNLNRLLYCLRRMIGKDYGGWFPAMGKNRDMESVAGQPHLSGTADEYPEPEPRPAAIAVQEGETAVRVGILDTKLYAHEDLANYVPYEDTLLTPEELAKPLPHYAGHCTFITGLVHRYAPSATLDVRWVLGNERATATAWDVARAMVGFKGSGVRILCLALGGYSNDNKPPLVLTRAIDRLTPEILVVAAAGNRARREATGDEPPPSADAGAPAWVERRPMWPGADPDVVAVGAAGLVDGTVTPADFSPTLPWMDLAAPGAGVISTFLKGPVFIDGKPPYPDGDKDFEHGYAKWSGTSAAVAIVAGRLATLASHLGGDADEALKRLRAGAKDASGAIEGGRVWSLRQN